jgi:hypothetical protein
LYLSAVINHSCGYDYMLTSLSYPGESLILYAAGGDSDNRQFVSKLFSVTEGNQC